MRRAERSEGIDQCGVSDELTGIDLTSDRQTAVRPVNSSCRRVTVVVAAVSNRKQETGEGLALVFVWF